MDEQSNVIEYIVVLAVIVVMIAGSIFLTIYTEWKI